MKETRVDVEDWISDIVENTINNYKGRKIVLWGVQHFIQNSCITERIS